MALFDNDWPVQPPGRELQTSELRRAINKKLEAMRNRIELWARLRAIQAPNLFPRDIDHLVQEAHIAAWLYFEKITRDVPLSEENLDHYMGLAYGRATLALRRDCVDQTRKATSGRSFRELHARGYFPDEWMRGGHRQSDPEEQLFAIELAEQVRATATTEDQRKLGDVAVQCARDGNYEPDTIYLCEAAGVSPNARHEWSRKIRRIWGRLQGTAPDETLKKE